MNTLSTLNLEKYEAALIEPMHDIGGHIENIFVELPYHLSKSREKFNEVWLISYKQKEVQRNCDRRLSLLTLVVNLYGKINHKAICLLKTFVEIQRILYLSEEGRTSQEILRLHNSCFTHFVLLKEVIGFNLHKLTSEKMYGKYMHNLLVHAPMQYRLINGQSINCEGEERFFNTIKQITRTTSSYRPGHIIGNVITRHQIESRCKDSYQFNTQSNQINKEINELSNVIENFKYDTLITYDYIKNNVADWQSHLQRISDSLLVCEGIWWKKSEFGVEFCDKSTHNKYPTKPEVHHYRSTNLCKIEKDLEDNWLNIIENKLSIPTHQIIEESEDNSKVIVKYTQFLQPFLQDKVQITTDILTTSLDIQDVEMYPSEENEEICVNIKEKNEEGIFQELNDIANQQKQIQDIVQQTTDYIHFDKEQTSTHQEQKKGREKENIMIESYTMLTKEGKLIEKVLGETPIELKKYDNLKFCAKHKQNKISDMLDFLILLQTKVLRKVSELEKEVEYWERLYFNENNFSAPVMNDRLKDPLHLGKFNRIKLGEKLKRYWKIKF